MPRPRGDGAVEVLPRVAPAFLVDVGLREAQQDVGLEFRVRMPLEDLAVSLRYLRDAGFQVKG